MDSCVHPPLPPPQVSLELGTLCKKYPDVSHEQLLCLLLLRGDHNKADAKQLASEFVAEGATANKAFHARSILSQVNWFI